MLEFSVIGDHCKARVFLQFLRWVHVLGAPALATIASGPALGSSWTIEQVYHSSGGLPGFQNDTRLLFVKPVLENDRILFCARRTYGGPGEPRELGIYLSDLQGNLTIIADRTMTAPDEMWTFNEWTHWGMDGDRIILSGRGAAGGECCGVYEWNGAGLDIIIRSGYPAPDGPGEFATVNGEDLSGSEAVIEAFINPPGQPSRTGIYVVGQRSVRTVVNSTMDVPGWPGVRFFSPNRPRIDQGRVVFDSNPIEEGIGGVYSDNSGELATIAEQTTIVPGLDVTFDGVGVPRIEDDRIAFYGFVFGDFQHRGIYEWRDGQIRALVDSFTVIPGVEQTFADFDSGYAVSSDILVFLGVDTLFQPTGEGALYSMIRDELTTILAPGDMLDGRTIRAFLLGPDGLTGSALAFSVRFEDDTSGLYIATRVTQGDANGDHLVNMADLNIVLGNFLRSGEPGLPGDVNDDGAVDLEDLNMVLAHFGVDCT